MTLSLWWLTPPADDSLGLDSGGLRRGSRRGRRRNRECGDQFLGKKQLEGLTGRREYPRPCMLAWKVAIPCETTSLEQSENVKGRESGGVGEDEKGRRPAERDSRMACGVPQAACGVRV
eukprot:3869799-Pleurochrysis_carterae.AAC.1